VRISKAALDASDRSRYNDNFVGQTPMKTQQPVMSAVRERERVVRILGGDSNFYVEVRNDGLETLAG
jgi:hypothetical protein